MTESICKHCADGLNCDYYDEKDFGYAGYARYCTLFSKLVYYIPECPMSSIKFKEGQV